MGEILNKKIGIWGLGVVGKSVEAFLNNQNVACSTFDSKINADADLESFLENNELIIPSPGINLEPQKKYAHKFLTELDLFFEYFKKPTISVTGSLGKTTVTFLIDKLLSANGFKSIAAGNIGFAMCDAIALQDNIDLAVLELSSFQIEYAKKFYSHISVLTNLYPNHLDRHGTLENYKQAKLNLFKNQTAQDKALLPLCMHADIENLKSQIYFFSVGFNQFDKFKNVYYLNDKQEVVFWNGACNRVICIVEDKCKNITFLENWLIIFATLDLYGCKKFAMFEDVQIPKHRMERFVKDGVVFYNDSKSTVMEATLKAVESCKNSILFLGGLSKGADRSLVIPKLKNKVKSIICFGKEAEDLNRFCVDNGIRSIAFGNLECAVEYCLSIAKAGDEVLFSPGGSSFDLFENYCKRGEKFKELINR